MSVIDNDLPGKTDEQLAAIERYYMTIQGQRAMNMGEQARLNAVLKEQHNRAAAVDLCS